MNRCLFYKLGRCQNPKRCPHEKIVKDEGRMCRVEGDLTGKEKRR